MGDNIALGLFTMLAFAGLARFLYIAITRSLSGETGLNNFFDLPILITGSIAIGIACHKSAQVRKSCIGLLITIIVGIILIQLIG